MEKFSPLIVDLPYPDVDTLTPDLFAGRVISFAYATLDGELAAICQYTYHSFNFGLFDEQTALLEERIAQAEMIHFDLLGNALIRLGIDPVLSTRPPEKRNFFDTSRLAYSTTREKMLMDDIAGELNAIATYKKMLTILKNEKVAALIERIVLDEELHVAQLQAALKATPTVKQTAAPQPVST